MYDTTQQFTLNPLNWIEVTVSTGLTRLVTISVTKKLVITKNQFDGTYDVDVHTECNSWSLHFGIKTIEDAKELAWKEHCKQLRNCLMPVDLFNQEELPL